MCMGKVMKYLSCKLGGEVFCVNLVIGGVI